MSVLDRIRSLETETDGVFVGTWKCGGCTEEKSWRIPANWSVAQQVGIRLDVVEVIDRHVELHAEANRAVPR